MLAAGAAILLATLYYLLLVEPLQQRAAMLGKTLRAEQDTRAFLEAQREAVARYAQAPVVNRDGRSVLSLINEAAATAGVDSQLKRITPVDESQVIAGFEAVPYAGFMRWLQTLVTVHGATVDRLRVERRPEAGQVSAELTLRFP